MEERIILILYHEELNEKEKKKRNPLHSLLRDITHKIMRENEINFIHIRAKRRKIIYFIKHTYRYPGNFCN